jgi:hypothetical protein
MRQRVVSVWGCLGLRRVGAGLRDGDVLCCTGGKTAHYLVNDRQAQLACAHALLDTVLSWDPMMHLGDRLVWNTCGQLTVR